MFLHDTSSGMLQMDFGVHNIMSETGETLDLTNQIKSSLLLAMDKNSVSDTITLSGTNLANCKRIRS